jgi:hypothetical protein
LRVLPRDPDAMISNLLSSGNKSQSRAGRFLVQFAFRFHNMQVDNHLTERPVFLLTGGLTM